MYMHVRMLLPPRAVDRPTRSPPHPHRTPTEAFLHARNMLQFWLRKRSTKKHEAKVQDIRRQVRAPSCLISLSHV